MKKAFFLDRDGVINRALIKNGKPIAPKTLEEFEIIPGVKEALNIIQQNDFLRIVVTNQPDIKIGLIKQEVLDAMHNKMLNELSLDDIFVCYDRNSYCYKPQPGMLLDAAKKYGIDLTKSYMVGDRWRDVGAGKSASCKTIFIDYGYDEKLKQVPDFTFKSLLAAVQEVLK